MAPLQEFNKFNKND